MTSLAVWRNETTRSAALQVGGVLLVFAAIAWLIGNVAANFAALDKTFGFGFLWNLPANYDINQTLIDYNSQSTHLRAALVGLLNTFLVAAIGIVLATILGFAVGALRLSENWLVSRLASAYVEFTRNTPVLLLILLWHGIIINTLPHPRQALSLGESVFLTNRGFYVPKPHFEDAIAYVIVVLLAGFALTWVLCRRRRDTPARRLSMAAGGIGVSLVVATIAFVLAGNPVRFETPALRGFNFQGGLSLIPELVALTWALAFYTSGFIAENVRAGIMSVERGQTDAARSLGLTQSRILRLIVLPQAMRVIVPPLTSSYLDLTKNSSLAIAIGYMDLVATLGGITLNQTGREMEAMLLVMAIYLLISLTIAAFMNWYNNRVRLLGR
ncbi:MAG: amino acid ABC transporter permease [Alphaproteobacteria bacterium]